VSPAPTIPPFPSRRPGPARHWALTAADVAVRVLLWLSVAVVLVLVLMVVMGVNAFFPIMRSGGMSGPRYRRPQRRRW